MPTSGETLGAALAAERRRRDLRQRQCAEHFGVSQPTFSAWENDVTEPGGAFLPAIAAWLQVSDTRLGMLLLGTKLRLAGRHLREVSEWRRRVRE